MRNPFKKEPSHDLSGVIRGVRARERKHMRHRWQWVALAIVVLLLATGGFFMYWYFQLQGDVQESLGGSVSHEKKTGDPYNVLLVGSDSREGLTKKEQQRLGARDVGSQRSDTIIVAHVDPATDRVTLLQFPRDYYVSIPGHGRGKINTAYDHGRKTLVRTVEQLSGLPINHYVEINIAGFRDLVNAIGGVDVCVPQKIPFDANTGIAIEQPGTYHFNGTSALAFVRNRHTVEGGDIGRIANQQKFMSAALNKLVSTGTLFHLSRLLDLKEVAKRNITVDDQTTILGLFRIAQRFRSFNPGDYEAYVAPCSRFATNEAGAVEIPNRAALRILARALAQNRSPAEADGVPDVNAAKITVGAYNATFHEGTVVEGVAGDLQRRLLDALPDDPKFVEPANAPHFRRKTVIRYAPGAKTKAEYIHAALPDVPMSEGKTPDGVDVALLVGLKPVSVRPVARLTPIEIPELGKLPEACRDTLAAPLKPTRE